LRVKSYPAIASEAVVIFLLGNEEWPSCFYFTEHSGECGTNPKAAPRFNPTNGELVNTSTRLVLYHESSFFFCQRTEEPRTVGVRTLIRIA
jgi:hypothetical protein